GRATSGPSAVGSSLAGNSEPLSVPSPLLRTANQIASQKYQNAADNHLKGGLQEWRVHVAMPDVADDAELHSHNNNRYYRGHVKIRNQEWQRVAQTAGRGHQSGCCSSYPWRAAPGQRTIVG